MNRRALITLLSGAAVAWPLVANAQQGEQMRRIGLLLAGDQDDPIRQSQLAALLEGLRVLGWEQGRNIQIEQRWGGADEKRFQAYAAELTDMAADVILANTTPAVAALQRATHSIPIVFAQISDPVSAGFVASLARPGRNMTGFSNFEYAIGGKWLQILKEIAPSISRAGVLVNPKDPAGPRYLRAVESDAPALGVQLTQLDIGDLETIERTIGSFARDPNGGLIVFPSPSASSNRARIAAHSVRNRLPVVCPYRYFVADGGLISYGIDPDDLQRRAASYVDRILKGEKPADLPVQAPTKYDLVINLKTAKALGLEVPPTLLARADEVIE